jgi:hypothetical protein
MLSWSMVPMDLLLTPHSVGNAEKKTSRATTDEQNLRYLRPRQRCPRQALLFGLQSIEPIKIIHRPTDRLTDRLTDRPTQSEAKRSEAKRSEAKQSKAKQSKAKQSKAKQTRGMKFSDPKELDVWNGKILLVLVGPRTSVLRGTVQTIVSCRDFVCATSPRFGVVLTRIASGG